MPINFSCKIKNPISTIRSVDEESLLIVYDVLGHFPRPRDHLSPQFCRNLNARAKNGFLFSYPGDLVLTSTELDFFHWQWLKSVQKAKGDLFLVHQNSSFEHESFFENFLNQIENNKKLEKELKRRNIKKIFSWMNSQNEFYFAQKENLNLAWNSPYEVIKIHFDKILFKKKVRQLGLPEIPFFSVLLPEESFFDWQEKIKEHFFKLKDDQKLIAKPANSAAGSGIFVFLKKDADFAYHKISSLESNIWLIEEFIEDCKSINIQIFVHHDKQSEYLGASEQLLENCRYKGNQGYPHMAKDEGLRQCFSQSQIIVDDLVREGYSGLIGLDFIVNSNNEAQVLENNIRINGSTFSLSLIAEVENLLQKELFWKFKKILFQKKVSFLDIQKAFINYLFSIENTPKIGLFIQEYSCHSDLTELAVIFWGLSESELEKLIHQFKNHIF